MVNTTKARRGGEGASSSAFYFFFRPVTSSQSIKKLKSLGFRDGGVARVINNVYLCTRYCAYCAGLKPSIH